MRWHFGNVTVLLEGFISFLWFLVFMDLLGYLYHGVVFVPHRNAFDFLFG